MSESGWAPVSRRGRNRGHGCCVFVRGRERPWELCPFPDCCRFQLTASCSVALLSAASDALKVKERRTESK